MGVVIPFPVKPNIDRELAMRLWELVASGQRHSAEYCGLEAEIRRRKSTCDAKRPLRHG